MKLRAWVDSTLQDTHDHYSCYLPANTGCLSALILKLFFSGIKIGPEQTDVLQKIPGNAIIIYVTKHKSFFEYLFYYTYYKRNALPFPEIGFDYKFFIWQPVSRIFRIFLAHLDHLFQNRSLPDPYDSDYIKQELNKNRTALLSLVEKKDFYRRFVKAKTDPIEYLIEMQKSIDRPIYLIPHLMFFGKSPHRSNPSVIDILFGTKTKPGKTRRLFTLFKNPGKIFVEISEPVSIKTMLELTQGHEQRVEYQALLLRRNLLLQFNRHRQSITGPVLKSKEELKENILTSDRLRDYMEKYSKKRDIPIHKVHKEADAYLEEIAAQYNIGVIKVFEVVLKWIFNTMFDGFTFNNDMFNKVKSMSRKGPLILVPCHKSHIDYLVLPYIFYTNNMPVPHIAAGKNLSFWPIGPLFRSCGAFFIRRTFKGAVLYAKVFAEYIYKLLQEGFNIKIFFEGGRSRTGKLLMPKLGLLSILINAYKDGACEDMIFVPIYIGYDRVIEESSYLNEIEGGSKRPESISQVLKAGKFLKKRYGKIYINFQEPISLAQYLSQYDSPLIEMTSKKKNALCRNLGYRVLSAIDSVSVVTPHALVASVILNCSKKIFSYDHFMAHFEIYMKYLFLQKARLADTLMIDRDYAVEQVLETYVQRKFIERISKDEEHRLQNALFKAVENKRPNLEYYKNNCISHFIPAAFTALAILEKDSFQFSASDLHSGYSFLQEFFKNEFAYDMDRTAEFFVRKNIKAFIDDVVITPHPTLPDTYDITSVGLRKLILFSSFLKTYFESYWIVLNFFMQYPKNSVPSKERMKKIQSIGSRMYKRNEVVRKESLSDINYQNAVDYFITHGVKDSSDRDSIDFYADSIQQYMKYM